MDVTLVYIHVKADRVDDFIESMRRNHEGSIREPGNFRFDVLQSVEDPARFVTYMAYEDEAATAAHRSTAHYPVWRDEVEPWMEEPRKLVHYRGLFPEHPKREARK